MKKYLFVFTVLAALATTACDTSSKASTTQSLTSAPVVAAQPQPQLATQPTVITDSTMLMRKKSQFKRATEGRIPSAPEEPKKTGN